jgi:hypothetical protein
MQKAFKHPLARKATTAKVHLRDGGEQMLLVVLTTMELDAGAKGFSQKNFNRLREAVEAYLAEAKGLAGYTVINRPKDWDA